MEGGATLRSEAFSECLAEMASEAEMSSAYDARQREWGQREWVVASGWASVVSSGMRSNAQSSDRLTPRKLYGKPPETPP